MHAHAIAPGRGRGGGVGRGRGSGCRACARAMPVVPTPSSWLVTLQSSRAAAFPRGPPGSPVPYSPNVYLHSFGLVISETLQEARSCHLPASFFALRLSVTLPRTTPMAVQRHRRAFISPNVWWAPALRWRYSETQEVPPSRSL